MSMLELNGLHSCISVARLLFFAACFVPFTSMAADTQPPTEPGSLRGIRYSSTAGEILWTPATDNVFVVGYRVKRDGQSLGIKDARSVFDGSLVPGQSYTFEVSAVDRAGNEGKPLVVQISKTIGTELTGTSATTGGGTSDGGTTDGGTSDGGTTDGGTTDGGTTGGGTTGGGDGGLILSSSSQRVTLKEGDPGGVSVSLSIRRTLAEKRKVTFSLTAPSAQDENEIRAHFTSKTLGPNESGTVLILRLDIGVAPLMKHQRRFQIIADDGVSRTATDLFVDVVPTAAPDVYLLIGQSNMEGYSEVGSRQRYAGGLDERSEQVRQLNVQPNSLTIFTNNSTFTNERANVSSPLFIPAEDPLHEPRYPGVSGKGASFVGLGLTFGKQAAEVTTTPVYLVPAAWGATGFCANSRGELAWNAEPSPKEHLGGTLLTDRALTRLNLTLRETRGILRGILWHQGGADSNNSLCANDYADNLSALVKRLRSEARKDARGSEARREEALIPFIVATQSKGDDERASFSNFNRSKLLVDAAHRTVSSYVPYSDFVNNDDLVPPDYPCGQVSCVHFGAASLREQGRRFFSALKRIWAEADAYSY